MLSNMLETIKKAAMEAVAASAPTNVLFGIVEGVGPLQIRIDQKTILPAEFFVLTSNVRQRKIIARAEQAESKNYTVDNTLHTGDKVLLLSQQGGQLYVILDKLEAGV